MKKLYVLIFIIFFSISVSYGQYGMNISGSHVIVHADTYLGMEGNLKISNTEGMIIKPDASVTTKGNLTLATARRGIVVQTGTTSDSYRGSYIVLGNVTHSGKGSMEAQSYITGLAGADTVYHMHFVGAPVEDTTSGYNNSVRLQQFDMTYLDTYAYRYFASVDTNDPATPWVNVWPYDYEILLGEGLTLTNGVAGSDTIVMEGYPVGNDITYTLTYNVANPYELISNPFPSAIDFDQFASDNSAYIFNKYKIWNASGGNYVYRSGGTGSYRYIQYGQAFFVVVRSSANGSNLTFNDGQKTHSTDPFRETNPDELAMYVEGGSIGFKDELYIRFKEDALSGLDDFDALKWNSINYQATMIRSIAEDGEELAINMLPPASLSTGETTVPIRFECGEEAEYTFTFKGIESFDMSTTEAYLEDKQLGNHWISIHDEGFEYHFTAAPGKYNDRFFIHFFGPTSTPEIGTDSENSLKIYASGNYAYVLNNTNETLKHVSVHNLMGKTIYTGTLPQQTLNKLFVSHQTGYYVVQVETDKKIYTQKVLIFDK